MGNDIGENTTLEEVVPYKYVNELLAPFVFAVFIPYSRPK